MISGTENSLAVVPYTASIHVLTNFHERERVIGLKNLDVYILQDWNGIGLSSVVWDAVSILHDRCRT